MQKICFGNLYFKRKHYTQDEIVNILIFGPDVISAFSNCVVAVEGKQGEIADNLLEKILTLYLRVFLYKGCYR